MTIDILAVIGGALLGCFALGCAAVWLSSRPLHAAWLVLAMLFLEASDTAGGFQLGIWLYPQDLFFFVLSLASLIRLGFASHKPVPAAWWVIGAVQLVLVAWGIAKIGTPAGVDARAHFYLWASVAYFCMIDWNDAAIARVASAWIACSAALCLLVYYRWLRCAVDPAYAAQIMSFDTSGVRFRVVSAEATLVMGIGLLLLQFRMMAGRLSSLQRLLLLALPPTVLVLQHRSVWVSLFVGAACLFGMRQRERKMHRGAAIALVALPLLLFFAIPGKDNSVLASVKGSADKAISTKEGTMVARVENWDELLSKWAGSGNPVTWLVGLPYGSGYNPVDPEDGIESFDMVPHNHLVHILYRGGLVCLYCTLLLFQRLWTRAFQAARHGRQRWAPCFVALLSTCFVFYIPYWATYVDGMLLGIAISYFGVRKRKPGAPIRSAPQRQDAAPRVEAPLLQRARPGHGRA